MDEAEGRPGEHGSDEAARRRIDRRKILKSAAALGAGAIAWSTPVVESIAVTPAVVGSPPPPPPDPEPCIILSPASDDKNNQQGSNYCPTPGPTCCGSSFGNSGQIDRFTFTNPAPNCTQIVVRTISLDCSAAATNPERNPDVGQFAVIIESTTGAGCGECEVLDAVLVASSGRAIIETMNNGPVSCPSGNGVDASLLCSNPNIGPSARLAVRMTCSTGNPGCV